MGEINLKELDRKFRESETQRIEAAAAAKVRADTENNRAKTVADKLDSFLSAQTDHVKLQEQRRESTNKLVFRGGIALLTVVLGGGGTAGYQAIAAPPTVESREVQDTVVEKSAAVETRVRKVEKRQKALGREAVRQHILITDTHKDLRSRLDAMSDKSRAIGTPPSVKAAEIRSARIREEIGSAKLFGDDTDAIDPFDLLTPSE